jgi:DNA-binding XRE family transcriptional regulator
MTPEEYKATRERLGTQAEAAAMLGVNRVTVAKRENGTMTITNEAVLAIQSLRRPRGKRKSENSDMTKSEMEDQVRHRVYVLNKDKRKYVPKAQAPFELVTSPQLGLGLNYFEATFSKHHAGRSMFEEDDV